jgi:rod shape-determining protein MreD
MAIVFFKRLGWFWLLVFIQVLVLNHVHLMGYAMPFLYVYLILTLNVNVSRNILLLWGFFLGLAVDIFSNTPGMNAAATTFLAFMRPSLLTLFTPRDCAEDMEPGIKSMGFWLFFRYVLVGVALHHTVLLTIESFSFFDLGFLSLEILSSTLLTTFCVMAIEGICKK